MGETLVTVVGNVATQPELKQTSTGVPVTRFRLATTERRFDRSGDKWTDGHTNFYTVWTWRNLAENVAGSVGIGEPVVVQGRLRVYEREDTGQSFPSVSIDAIAIGHDLTKGTSAFRRVFRARSDWTDRSIDASDTPDSVSAAPATASPANSAATTGKATVETSREAELVPS